MMLLLLRRPDRASYIRVSFLQSKFLDNKAVYIGVSFLQSAVVDVLFRPHKFSVARYTKAVYIVLQSAAVVVRLPNLQVLGS